MLNSEQRFTYFGTLKNTTGLGWSEISKILGINPRMLRSWRSGEYTIPKDLFEKIEKILGIEPPENYSLKKDFWHIKSAAKKGAYQRYILYGNLGTHEGRRKGGLNSLKSEKLKKTNFKFLKSISSPEYSEQLAELVGILIGDGGITEFQTKVSLGLKTDEEYSLYVRNLIEILFRLNASLIVLKDHSTLEVIVSSKNLVVFLNNLGLPIGNKIKQEIDIPDWIKKNREFSKKCIRGIFDTDGCVYIDKHQRKDHSYSSINVAITSASPKLLDSIYLILLKDGFNPTKSSYRSIRLRKSQEVFRFFNEIGSSNIKHLNRFRKFLNMERYSSGHTSTVSKTVGAN